MPVYRESWSRSIDGVGQHTRVGKHTIVSFEDRFEHDYIVRAVLRTIAADVRCDRCQTTRSGDRLQQRLPGIRSGIRLSQGPDTQRSYSSAVVWQMSES